MEITNQISTEKYHVKDFTKSDTSSIQNPILELEMHEITEYWEAVHKIKSAVTQQ